MASTWIREVARQVLEGLVVLDSAGRVRSFRAAPYQLEILVRQR
jgi:hypothetical protein